MVRRDRDAEAELNLPAGFRFHPTDEELIVDYLCRKVAKQVLPVPIIAEVDLYKFDPWLLPEKAMFGQKEWYFFTPRERKYPNGSRPNRAAGHGYWKATGADKPVTPVGRHKPLGIKKALVFYTGRSPQGVKTNWIMHEYRLADANRSRHRGTIRLDDWVLCRLYNKKSNWEQEMQHNSPQEGSSAETADSDLAFTSQQSPESYVGNHRIRINAQCQQANMVIGQNGLPNTHAGGTGESSDWFMDLNLDELHGSFAAGTGGGSDAGSYQDYCLALLPQLKPPGNFGNLPPF